MKKLLNKYLPSFLSVVILATAGFFWVHIDTAKAAVSIVAHNGCHSTATQANYTCTSSGSIATGDMVVAFVAWRYPAAVVAGDSLETTTICGGATTQISSKAFDPNRGVFMETFYLVATTTSSCIVSTTFTAGQPNPYLDIEIYDVTGQAASPIDAAGKGNSDTQDPSITALTLTDTDLILAGAANPANGSVAYTVGTGFAAIDDAFPAGTDKSSAYESKTGATSSITPNFVSIATFWVMVAVAIKPAASAPAVPATGEVTIKGSAGAVKIDGTGGSVKITGY